VREDTIVFGIAVPFVITSIKNSSQALHYDKIQLLTVKLFAKPGFLNGGSGFFIASRFSRVRRWTIVEFLQFLRKF
jgi:hypothetical protein